MTNAAARLLTWSLRLRKGRKSTATVIFDDLSRGSCPMTANENLCSGRSTSGYHQAAIMITCPSCLERVDAAAAACPRCGALVTLIDSGISTVAVDVAAAQGVARAPDRVGSRFVSGTIIATRYRIVTTGRTRWHGRSVQSGRLEACSGDRVEVHARRDRTRRRCPREVPRGGPDRAPRVASERLPRARHQRGRRVALSHHGIHRRGESRIAVAPDRAPSARHSDRDYAADLCRPCRRAQRRRNSPRPEAVQRHDRRPGPRASYGFRHCGDCQACSRCTRDRRNPCVHGA